MSNVHGDIGKAGRDYEEHNAASGIGSGRYPVHFECGTSGSGFCRESFKGSSWPAGRGGSPEEREGRGRRGDGEKISPRGTGTRSIIRRRNGMRFWNFVLFVRPVISIDESRGRQRSPLRVFYGDISRGTNKSNISMGPYTFGPPRHATPCHTAPILLHPDRGISRTHLPRGNISTLKAAFGAL